MDCTKLCNVKFFNFLSLTFDSVFRFRFRFSFRIPDSGFHVLIGAADIADFKATSLKLKYS